MWAPIIQNGEPNFLAFFKVQSYDLSKKTIKNGNFFVSDY